MFERDHWQEIWAALSRNKLRTFLTAFGVFWGLFMLSLMLGSGNGLRNGVYDDFAGTATNTFFVWGRRSSLPFDGLPKGRPVRLTNEDTEAIRRNVPQAAVVAPRAQLRGYGSGNNVSRGTRSGAFTVMGDTPDIHRIEKVRMTAGRQLNPLDLAERRKVAVIGPRVREVLFEDDPRVLGEQLMINGVTFTVVGSYETVQAGGNDDDQSRTIHIPLTTFQRAFSYGEHVGWFAITSVDEVPASVAEASVLELMRQRKRLSPEDERALGHFNLEEEFNEISGLFWAIRTLIWIVGSGTLAAGVIGVSNIMLVIVRERTSEIGIRRSVGATPMAVMGQILMEAMVLTALAGYVGLFCGVGAVELVNVALGGANAGMFKNPEVAVATLGKAMGILIVAGTLAGLIPARRAVKIRPVEALRAI